MESPMETAASEAAIKFEDVFQFSKMDTMIHRFPPGLGEVISSRYPDMVAPTFVAIGLYHHGKKHLEKMEAVKKAAARFLWQHSEELKDAVSQAAAYYSKLCVLDALDDAARGVVDAVDEARSLYFAGETLTEEGKNMMKDDDGAQFADMIICDACFLLLYMDAYIRSYGKKDGDSGVNESMRRFLFRHRDRINNDIMLLENQLPWVVLQVLMDLASNLKLKRTVEYFVAAMGSSFKIRQSSELKPFVWDAKNDPPPHLLALLRRHTTTQEPHAVALHSDGDGGAENTNSNHPSNSLQEPLITQSSLPSDDLEQQISIKTDNPRRTRQQEVVVSAMSPMDLEQIGIRLVGSKTEKFSDMGLEKGRLLSRLRLAPLSLGDTGASWLVNMAAFEVCAASRFGDPAHMTAVCSYLKLLAFFMAGTEDVRRLRSMGLLRGPHRDDDVLALFQTLNKHLSDYGTRFAEVMAGIEEYKRKRYVMTTLYRWVYNNWKTASAVFSLALAAVSAIAAIIGLYKALLSLIHN